MAYQKLKQFQDIIQSQDFTYFSDPSVQSNLFESILSITTIDDLNALKEISETIAKYQKNILSFFNWFKGKNIPQIAQGVNQVIVSLDDLKRLIKLPLTQKKIIKLKRFKKYVAEIQVGLNLILAGIRISFQWEGASSVNISRDQLARFILDEMEGYGRKYRFNKTGVHAFRRKILSPVITKRHLLAVEKLLTTKHHVRTFNHWEDLGKGADPVRILVVPHKIKKDRAYFLFTVNEHDDYEKALNTSPDNVPFADSDSKFH